LSFLIALHRSGLSKDHFLFVLLYYGEFLSTVLLESRNITPVASACDVG
jgi:hypothetical protein